MKKYFTAGLISLLLSSNAIGFTASSTHDAAIQATPITNYINLTNPYGSLWTTNSLNAFSTIFTASNGLSMFTMWNKADETFRATYKSCVLEIDEYGGSLTNNAEGNPFYDPNACNVLETLSIQYRAYMDFEYDMAFPANIEENLIEVEDGADERDECKEKAIWTGIAITAGGVALVFIEPVGPFIAGYISWVAASKLAIDDVEDKCQNDEPGDGDDSGDGSRSGGW